MLTVDQWLTLQWDGVPYDLLNAVLPKIKDTNLHAVEVYGRMILQERELIQLREELNGLEGFWNFDILKISPGPAIDNLLIQFFGIDPGFLTGAIRIEDIVTTVVQHEIFVKIKDDGRKIIIRREAEDTEETGEESEDESEAHCRRTHTIIEESRGKTDEVYYRFRYFVFEYDDVIDVEAMTRVPCDPTH